MTAHLHVYNQLDPFINIDSSPKVSRLFHSPILVNEKIPNPKSGAFSPLFDVSKIVISSCYCIRNFISDKIHEHKYLTQLQLKIQTNFHMYHGKNFAHTTLIESVVPEMLLQGWF